MFDSTDDKISKADLKPQQEATVRDSIDAFNTIKKLSLDFMLAIRWKPSADTSPEMLGNRLATQLIENFKAQEGK